LADRFSIIIVHRNGPETLLRALDALAAAIDPARDKVFISDNGSSDVSLARARDAHPAVRIIENGCNMGYAAAINQAKPLSNSQYLLFLNSDTYVRAGLFERFETLFGDNPKAAIIGPTLVTPEGQQSRSFGVDYTVAGECGLRWFRRGRPPAPEREVAPVDSIDNGFFFYFEDVELCVRLRQAGWEALLDQGSMATHVMGLSTRPVQREARIELLRSRLRFYKLYFPPSTALLLGWYRFFRLVVNTVSRFLVVCLTLGLEPRSRTRFLDYGAQLAWWLAGRPESWGLPHKRKEESR
jgi:GT2 family glycosyltransferase